MESAAIRDVKSAGDEKEEQQEEPVENSRYICKICSKKFASGRALGGHMRAHGPVPMAAAAEHSERLGVPQEFQKKRSRVPEFQAGEDDECNKSIEEEQEDDDNEEEEFHLNGNNPMYALRRNPKRSWRFADRDYLFLVHAESDVSASKIGNSSTYLRNSRICEVCGKEFSSWKALFGHMRCHSDRLWKSHQDREGDDGDCLEKNWEISQKSESREEEEEEEEEEESEESESDTENEQPQSVQWPTGNSSRFDQWMKGKRSRRPRCTVQPPPPPPPQPGQSQSEYNDEENMAICLVMLSSGVNTMEAGKLRFSGAEEVVGTSGSRDMQVVPHTGENAFELQKCIKKRPKSKKIDIGVNDACDDVEFKRSSYKCSTCNKVFHSYQALGGHRASHKKVKGCSSRLDLPEENGSLEEEITDEELITRSSHQLSIDFHKPPPKTQSKDTCSEAREESDETTIPVTLKASNKKSKVHECSICHRVFGSGQALGGHKRCHWGGAGTSDTISTVSSIKDPPQQQQRPARVELLDLNLPAPVDDDDDGLQIEDAGQLNNFGGIVVDSHRPSDAEAHSKVSPPYFQPWWVGNYPKQGLFLYNRPPHLSRDDEADSKLGSKSGLSRGQDSDSQNRTRPWFQL